MEELLGVLRGGGVLRLLVHEDEVGGGERPGVLARRIGHHQVEVLGIGPVGAGARGGEGLVARLHEVAGGILQISAERRVGQEWVSTCRSRGWRDNDTQEELWERI